MKKKTVLQRYLIEHGPEREYQARILFYLAKTSFANLSVHVDYEEIAFVTAIHPTVCRKVIRELVVLGFLRNSGNFRFEILISSRAIKE